MSKWLTKAPHIKRIRLFEIGAVFFKTEKVTNNVTKTPTQKGMSSWRYCGFFSTLTLVIAIKI